MIAINPKCHPFEVKVCEEIFVRLVLRNQRFYKRFIDDSNEYKFIYVPASSSTEKKTHFRLPLGFLIFTGESLSRSNRSLDKRFDLPCDKSLHPVSHAHVTNCCH